MATSPTVGGADPAILKSLETQTPSVARTAPATVNASTGTATSSGSSVSRGLTPQVSGGTVTYNQATQATAGNSVTVTSSTSNDPGDVVTIYTSPKAVSVSAINQTVNTYKVNNYAGNEYTDSNVAAYLPTYTGNVGASNVNVTDTIYTNDLSSTGLASLTTLNVAATTNLGAVGNVTITGGTNGQVLTTNGSNVLSWTTVAGGSYSNSNVAAYLPTYTGNVGGNVVTANLFSGNGSSLTNLPITEDTTGVDKFVLISDGNLKYSGSVMITPDTGNIVTLGKINSGNIIANGNVTANYFIGNGSSLNSIAGANVSGFVPNANIANTAFSIAGANVTGTVGNANLSQYLNVSDVNNNFSYHVVLSAGSGDKSLHIDADDNLQYNPADGTLTATRVDATYFVGNLNFANGYLASNLVGSASNIVNGNSNVSISTANGNITLSAVGTANVLVITGTGANITGTANVSGTANVGDLNAVGIVKTGVFATANIPAAAIAGAGARAFVTDATLATFGSAYVGGAANAVPVWSDGTGWFIG